jgi:hypothetical protein
VVTRSPGCFAYRAAEDAAQALQRIRERAPQLKASQVVLEGSPQQRTVEEAERWKADLIVLGSHGRGQVGRFLLGSVAHAVVQHSPCSAEIVRDERALLAAARARSTRTGKAKRTGTGRSRPTATTKQRRT